MVSQGFVIFFVILGLVRDVGVRFSLFCGFDHTSLPFLNVPPLNGK